MAFLDRLLSDRPELFALAIWLVEVTATRWGLSRLPITRLVARILAFLAFTYFLYQAHQIPYLVSPPSGNAFARFLGDALKAIWWFWAAAICADMLRGFTFRGAQLAGHRLFRDLGVAGIYLCALVGLITFVLNLPVQGILVTSGAVAVVLGLALQSSLGDVFYGIVLSLGKPFNAGDWISLDNGAEGKVIEMNWRETHLLTDHQDVVIVPNNLIGKAKIINASFPSRIHGTTIIVPLAANTSPMIASQLLSDATLGCLAVLSNPPPAIVIKSISREALSVEITFFTSEVAGSADAQNRVYEKIFRSLGAAGIGLGSRISPSAQDAPSRPPTAFEDAERLVAFTPVFLRLTQAERAVIASGMTREIIEPGTTVLKVGIVSQAMYVVGSGVLSATREEAGRTLEIGRLSTTDHFGAGGLLGGTPTLATVAALTRAVVFRLEKNDLAKLVEARPGFADDLSRELAARRLIGSNAIETQDLTGGSEENLAHWFAQYLRRAWQRTSSNGEKKDRASR